MRPLNIGQPILNLFVAPGLIVEIQLGNVVLKHFPCLIENLYDDLVVFQFFRTRSASKIVQSTLTANIPSQIAQ